MKIHIGIDVSKLHLDLCQHQQSTQIPNTEKAIRRWLKSLPPATVLVCEASGGYEALLVTLAHAAQRPIARLNARQVRDFAKAKGRLARTDKLDAQLLVDFAETYHPEPLALPDPLQQELAALVKHRAHLLMQITHTNTLAETLPDKNLLALIDRTVG